MRKNIVGAIIISRTVNYISNPADNEMDILHFLLMY